MKNNNPNPPPGFSLLEMTVSLAILATLATSSMVLVRTSYTAWNRHEDDHAERRAGLAVLRHITRQARQVRAVTAISAAADNSGTLSLLTSGGQVLVWDHDAATKEVRFGVGTATELLATNIEQLNFVGIKVNGSDQTIDPGLIHLIQCTTQVVLNRPAGAEAIDSSCRVWIRTW